MEMKLNIYNKREIEKTYRAETYDLMFGTVEDLIDILDLDKLKTGADQEIIAMVVGAIPKCMGIIKPLLKDVFEGLTDDELKHTKVKEIAACIVEIVKFTIAEINLGANTKN